MSGVPASSHGPVAGTYLPTADAAGVTVDTTTYNNTWTNVGKLTTLVFPQSTGALALAIAGDAFPRMVMLANPGDGTYWGDGTVSPFADGPAWSIGGKDANGDFAQMLEAGTGHLIVHGDLDANVGARTKFNKGVAVSRDANPGAPVSISGGAGAPAIGGNVGDIYIRANGGALSTLYRCTGAGVAGAATWAGIL